MLLIHWKSKGVMDLFPPLVVHQVICCLYTFSCHVTTPAPSLTMLTCHTIYKQVVSGATKLFSCSTLLPFSILILPIHMTIRWLKEAQPILYQFKNKLSQRKNWTRTFCLWEIYFFLGFSTWLLLVCGDCPFLPLLYNVRYPCYWNTLLLYKSILFLILFHRSYICRPCFFF